MIICEKLDSRSSDAYIPHRLPLLQEAAAELVNELVEPETDEAKVEICLFTSVLPQKGQTISPTLLALRTSSSNGVPHSLHLNSKIGINYSFNVRTGDYEQFCCPS